MTNQTKDPLHGVTLKMMMEELHAELGWDGLAARININCFKSNPSIKSSLTFLRRTPWAKEKVENLYKKSKGIKVNRTKSESLKSSEQNQGFNPWLKNR